MLRVAVTMATARISVDVDNISGSLRDRIIVFLDDLQNFNESTLLENYVQQYSSTSILLS